MNLRNKNLIKDFGYDSFVLSGGMQGGGGVAEDLLTTKGDTHGYTTENARVPIGTDGQILTADSSVPLGLAWETTGGGTEFNTFTTATTWNPTTQTGNTIVTVDATDLSVGSVFVKVDGSNAVNVTSGSSTNIVNPSTSLSVETTNEGFQYASPTLVSSTSMGFTSQYAFGFANDGSSFYLIGNYTDAYVRQYNLTTPWDTTAWTTGGSLYLYPSIHYARSMNFANGGNYLFVGGTGGTQGDTFVRYTLSTPYDVSTGSSPVYTASPTASEATSNGFTFSNNGTKFYTTGGGYLRKYNLSTAWSLTGSLTSPSVSTPTTFDNTNSLTFNSDGSEVYTVQSGIVYKSTLTTPFDVTTASTPSSVWNSGFTNFGSNLLPNGENFFAMMGSGATIKKWSTNNAYSGTVRSSVG